VASDMQDDLRKMIERLLNQKRGPKRKVVLLIARQIGVTDPRPTETPKGGRRRRPRPMPKPCRPEGSQTN
jgi:hypothetical protein